MKLSALPVEVRVCTYISFVVALGFGVIAPALPILAEQFGAGSTLVGLAISAMAFMRFSTAVVNSRFVARFGEKHVLAVGLWMQAVSTIAAAMAPNMELLVALRALGGVGSSAFTVAAMSLVLRRAPHGRSGEALSVFQSGFMLGAIVGPGLGGLVADINARLPFLLYGVLLIIAGFIAHVRLPETTPEARAAQDAEAEDADTGRTPLPRLTYVLALATALAVNFGTGWLFYGVRNSVIPMYASDTLHASGTYVGTSLLTAAAIQVVSVRLFGRWVDARGRRLPLITATALGTISVLLLALAPGHTAFLVSMMLGGVAGGGIAAGAVAVLADVSHTHRARNVAWFNMAGDLGGIIGPVATGAVADVIGFGVGFGLTAGVLAAGLVMTLVMRESMTRPTLPAPTPAPVSAPGPAPGPVPGPAPGPAPGTEKGQTRWTNNS